MGFISEKIIEIGIDAGLECISAHINDQPFGKEYTRIVSEYLDNYWEKFSDASLDEEFDFEGLFELLRSPGMTIIVKKAVAGTQAERKNARASLYDTAIAHSHAQTAESRAQIRKIVSAILNALRLIERDKVPLETRVLVADTIEDINSHSDENTNRVLAEIKELRTSLGGTLQTDTKRRYGNLRSAILDNGGRVLSDGAVLFNLKNLDRDILGAADDNDIHFMKEQLGRRLSGSEDREEIITLFWAETKMTLQSGKRHDVMPMFQDLVRDTCSAFIYVDQIPRIVDRVHLARFYWDEYDVFHLQGDKYIIRILLFNNIPVAISMSYNFGNLSDVHERLFYFDKIKPIVESDHIQIIGEGAEKYNIAMDMSDLEEDWRNHVELTEYWIGQMNKIAKIEQYYHIHFDLPQKAEEEEYLAIEILFDSIHRKSCITLPGLPGEEVGDVDREEGIVFEEEISIGCPDHLMDLHLFGRTFIPIDEYIIPCVLCWNDDSNCFETEEGGIPTGVEFSLNAS